MAAIPARPESSETGSDIFDRAHLAHYTMNSEELEREIIALFLMQLPATIEMIELAETAEAWKLATHTLKGAAAAVGAKRLQDIAASLEALEPGMPADQKAVHLQALRAAAAEFRLEAGKIYP